MVHIGGARSAFLLYDSVQRRLRGAPEEQRERRVYDAVGEDRDIFFAIYPPRRIHHFLESTTVLGEGGQGKVFRSTPTELGAQRIPILELGATYALKQIPMKDHVANPSFMGLKRQRRLDLIDALRCEETSEANLVRFFAFVAEYPRNFFSVVELLEGPDLHDYLRNRDRTVEEREAAHLTRQIFTAIHYLHRKAGMLHRDIKPQNFGFAQPLQAQLPGDLPPLKLFDFGLHWALPEVVTEESCRNVVRVEPAGTPQYLAPEGWRGSCWPGLDIWGAGVIVYIMLSLDLPFGIGSCPRRGRTAVTRNELAFPEGQWSDVSPAAQELVASILEKAVDRRASTVEVLGSEWLSRPGEGAGVRRCLTAPVLEKSLGNLGSMIFQPAAGITEPLPGNPEDSD